MASLNKKEKKLLTAYKNGGPSAFEAIFAEYRELVFRVAYSLTGEREAALDISQEVFLRLYKHLKSFKGQSSLRTWIYRITLNRALSHLKKRTFLPLFDFLRQRPSQVDPLREAERSEAEEHLQKALSYLSRQQKQAFILKNQEGLRYSEIADILGIKTGTVKALIYQASNKLRKRLKKKYGIR